MTSVHGGADLDTLARVAGRIRASIEKVIEGKPEVTELALVVLLSDGHLLIEDVPGVGKTMLSKALARSIDCSVRRIQFTPDLLPSDITGVSVFNQDTREFEFRPGGIFANIVVGDEINRASPKTQSALLECMEERQVTVDGATYVLDSPFMVIATQNPIEMEGTYALPEAQRDRFMARVSMGYPVPSAEIAMLDTHTWANPLDDLEPVADAAEIRKLIDIVGQVHVSEPVQRYAVSISTATRTSPELVLGASPRATLHLVRAAKAYAALRGRDYVLPDDVQGLAVQVLSHRLLATVEASMSGRTPEAALRQIVASVPMPPTRGAAMREALSGLTTRGRAFVAAGAAALLCAVVLGQDALVRVGALLLLLPFLTAFLLGRSRYRLGLVRTLTPTHVTAGQQAVVQLDLTNDGTMPTGLLLLEDRVPHALGTGPRFVIDRMGLGWHRTVDYPVSCDVRGIFTVGPMRVSLKDPFGLVELERTFTSTSPLVVTPRVVSLPVVPLSGVWTGAGDNRPHSFAHGSAEDVTVREYRRGDDLRRVHWRSSAHAGELMVRREEQPWQSRATLFVDNRASSHRGPGAASSFEHAVTVAASIAVHLVQRGFTVRLVTARSDARSGSWHEHRAAAAETGPLLESLAVLTETADHRIDTGWLADSAPSGLLITVLGSVAERDTAALSRMRHSASTAMALVLDVPAWAHGGHPPAGTSAVPSTGSDTARQVGWLGAHGWRTAVAGPTDPLAGVWQELGSARRRPTGAVLATPADRTFERPTTGTP